MAENILKLKVDSQEYDSKIKRAAQGLTHFVDAAHKQGDVIGRLVGDTKKYVDSIGKMETVNKTARGSLGELKYAFTELRHVYNQLSAEEKKGDFGKQLNAQLAQLKTRIQESRKELAGIEQEISGNKFGQFGSILDGIGQKMGINANLTDLLTSKTALLTGAIGASIAVIGKATQEWAKYNSELAKQDQVTTVTTGLQGYDSKRMTDQARAMVDTYNVDFRETINAANTLMSQFGKTGDEAMGLIRDGMRGMIQGDGPKLLSMIQQYAPSFRDAGIEASQLVAIIQNSEGGLFTDQNMNSIVMGIKNIRLMTKATSDALAKLGIDGQEMTRKLNDGSMTIFEAMQQVSKAINGAGSSSQAAGEVMQQVFGRQGAAAGTKLGEAIATLNTNLDETKRKTGELGDAYDDLYEANVKLNGAIRDCFEYDGWEQMSKGIEAHLVHALSVVIEKLATIKSMLTGMPKPGHLRQADNDRTQDMNRRLEEMRTGGFVEHRNRVNEAYYANEINRRQEAVDMWNRWRSEGHGGVTPEQIAQIREQYGTNTKAINDEIKEWKKTRDEYRKGFKEILTNAEKNDNPDEIKPFNPNKPTTTTHTKTAQERASDIIKEAERAYAESLKKAAMEQEAGRATDADVKKKTYAAQEQLWSAYGKAYATYADPKYKEAQDKLEKEIVAMGGEVNKAVEAQKAAEKASRELEAAEKNLADAQTKLAEAQATGSATAIYKAEENVKKQQANVDVLSGKMPQGQVVEYTIEVNTDQLEKLKELPTNDETIRVNVEQGNVDLPDIPSEDKTIHVNVAATTDEARETIQKFINDTSSKAVDIKVKPVAEGGTQVSMFEGLKQTVQAEIKFDQMKVDETTLHTLLQAALQNGLDNLTVDYGGLQERIARGIDIPDSTWQSLQDEINEALKKLGIEPIKIDIKTGNLKQVTEETKVSQKAFSMAANSAQQLGSALSQMEDPSIKAAGTVLQAIANIALGFSMAVAQAGSMGPWAWLAYVAAGTAAMATTISTIHSLTGYAEGGVVKGNTYSGDMIPATVDGSGLVGLNAGEVVLNRAQTGNLASQLQGGGGNSVGVRGIIRGEDILLVANRSSIRQGKGELLTW